MAVGIIPSAITRAKIRDITRFFTEYLLSSKKKRRLALLLIQLEDRQAALPWWMASLDCGGDFVLGVQEFAVLNTSQASMKLFPRRAGVEVVGQLALPPGPEGVGGEVVRRRYA